MVKHYEISVQIAVKDDIGGQALQRRIAEAIDRLADVGRDDDGFVRYSHPSVKRIK